MEEGKKEGGRRGVERGGGWEEEGVGQKEGEVKERGEGLESLDADEQ